MLEKQAAGRAWLVLVKSDYRRLSSGDLYDDEASTHYSWDSRVPNFRQVKPGDIIAVWDERELIGASVIESIAEGVGNRPLARCPRCRKTNIERRTTLTPTFRCYECKATFDEPELEDAQVRTFRSTHSQGWVDLTGTLSGTELRALCVKPRSQNSIREIHWDEFERAVRASAVGDPLLPVATTAAQIRGGHLLRPVRVRLGQAGFRAELLRRFGDNCAFSGPLPRPALEACHLYSYAEVGHHDPHGGILLRRDLHSLFDRGLIAVDSGIIDVAEQIRTYPLYKQLHRRPFGIDPTPKQRSWLQMHWNEFRSA
ncbi:HNH endonuclease [Nocardia yunnanensis]|uniref:HNH endonuclease n=1 Tax=Nocardia yunnanensis TaxID=2382165 RepID=A0A386ZBU5_9NOCA|nr:HNH endonuclease signature motif containing protein [Nocardia yunnanensis]AYF75131.1 HNH endonuclease [Nocardia yunnanensis]